MATTTAIYRVSDGILNRKHLAYSAVQPAFCGRVPREYTQGGNMRWRTMSNPEYELPTGTKMCRECERSPLNTAARQLKREGLG